MSRAVIRLVLGALLLAISFPAKAQQQPKKLPLIAYLSGQSLSASSPRFEAFQQGLRELGYVNGKNIVVEARYADGEFDRLPALAAELVRLKADIIIAQTATVARAARQATKTIPIVMASGGDIVAEGLVGSLAQPGGNVTGLSNIAPELSGKRLELLKEAFPKISRVAFLFDGSRPGSPSVKETLIAAQALGMHLQSLEVKGPNPDFGGAFATATRERAHALVTTPQPFIGTHSRRIIELAAKSQLPAMYPFSSWVEQGGLMSYGANQIDLARRAATYVDKILKGTKPAELPVEQPTKFELAINLKTAKQIGVTIPQSVLYRADKVIK